MSIEDLKTHRVSIYAMYFKIAHDSCDRWNALAKEYESLNNEALASADDLRPISDRMYECSLQQRQCTVTGITFASMALEAFFYDYAAEVLGDGYVKDHLDKLDLKSKFLVYPRLVCQRSPDRSKAAYSGLSNLVRLRNELVHFKSKQFPYTQLDRATEHYDDLDERLKTGMFDAIGCVTKVMVELDALHDNNQSFGKRMRGLIDER
jgi:hypothetical protein